MILARTWKLRVKRTGQSNRPWSIQKMTRGMAFQIARYETFADAVEALPRVWRRTARLEAQMRRERIWAA